MKNYYSASAHDMAEAEELYRAYCRKRDAEKRVYEAQVTPIMSASNPRCPYAACQREQHGKKPGRPTTCVWCHRPFLVPLGVRPRNNFASVATHFTWHTGPAQRPQRTFAYHA